MDYTKEYLPHDQHIAINENDSVLHKIVLKLPEPPPLHLIHGYGLQKVEQKFTRLEVPIKFQHIEKRARRKAEEYNESNKNNRANGFIIQKYFWQIVEEEKDSLQEEILWLKHVWWYLRYGYWFYCYGKPTWITPWYFFYLNFYYIDEAGCFPEYRDVDRRTELAEWYAFTCTETFKNVNEDGIALDYEMQDLGHRLFFGTIRPKRRRGGATAQCVSKGEWMMMFIKSAYCDITADTGKHAEGIFNEKLVPAWYHMPLVIKPVWDGDERPSKKISLIHPKSAMREECMCSEFGYTETSSERANDSRKITYGLYDEQGKGAVRGSVIARYGINKETLAQDLIIRGYCNNPSTVEEMSDGGSEYKAMFDMSDFYQRKPSGQTTMGLLRIFTKSYDGIDGFVDPWGYSVIFDPTEDQMKYGGDRLYVSLRKGSKQSIEDELNTYLRDGSYDKLQEYRRLLRKKPLDSTDCWRGASGNIGFNIIILDKAIVDAKYQSVVQGNFEWAGGVRDTRVVFKEDKRGKWLVSDLFVGKNNLWRYDMSLYQDPNTGERMRTRWPLNLNLTTLGIDSFKWRGTSQTKSAEYGENTSLSDGAGATYLRYNPALEGDKPTNEWYTPRFICTYRNRPELNVYFEDMLMQAFYYGSTVNGERITTDIIEYFIRRGYAGYLGYIMDAKGIVAPQPFTWSSEATKGAMLSLLRQHIDIHGHHECHIDLLTEWKNLSSPQDLHTKDLCAASGWAIYISENGAQGKYDRISKFQVIQLENSRFKPRKM